MAEIKTQYCTFRLTPLAWEYANESWIRSELSLTLNGRGQQLHLQPKTTPTLTLHSYRNLLDGTRKFVDSNVTSDGDLFSEVETFLFVPPELDFEFAVLEADLSPDAEGEISIRVMIRVGEDESALMGSTFSVNAFYLKRFLDRLEQELNQIAEKQSESSLAIAEV